MNHMDLAEVVAAEPSVQNIYKDFIALLSKKPNVEPNPVCLADMTAEAPPKRFWLIATADAADKTTIPAEQWATLPSWMHHPIERELCKNAKQRALMQKQLREATYIYIYVYIRT